MTKEIIFTIFAMVVCPFHFAFGAPKDYGFLLDRTYVNHKVFQNAAGDRLLIRRYRTSIPMDPLKIKPEHRIPLLELSRNFFQRGFGITDWKVGGYDIQRGRQSSTIVSVQGTFRSAKKKKYFFERYYHQGQEHIYVLLSSTKDQKNFDSILRSLGPVSLLPGRTPASEAINDDSGVDSSAASLAQISPPQTMSGRAAASLEDVAEMMKVKNKTLCENVPETKRNPIVSQWGLVDDKRANFWDYSGGALLSCMEGFGHATWDTLIGLTDMVVAGWDGVVGGKWGQSLGGSLADYADANRERLAGDDNHVDFGEALWGVTKDTFSWAVSSMSSARDEQQKKWNIKLSKQETGGLERLYYEYISSSAATSTAAALAEQAWEGARQVLKPLMDVVSEFLKKEYGQLLQCLSPSEQAKYICRTAGYVIEFLGASDLVLGKIAEKTFEIGTVARAAKLAARDFLDAPSPKKVKGAKKLEETAEVARAAALPNEAWRRLPSGEQVAVIDNKPVIRHRPTESANSAKANKAKSKEAATTARSPDGNFEYTEVPQQGPYRNLVARIENREIPVTSVRVPRPDQDVFRRLPDQTPADYVQELSVSHLTRLPDNTANRLADVLDKNPAYADELGDMLREVQRSSNKDIVKESTRLFQRVSEAIARSDQDLPQLGLLRSAVKSGDSGMVRQVSELYAKVTNRMDQRARKGAVRAGANSFDQELDLLAKEKLGDRVPEKWDEQKACLVDRAE